MTEFLGDYNLGRAEGRYLAESLPDLSLPSGSFDLALCSHLLFLYSDNLSLNFHKEAIAEMCRVAHEVRIFPLVTYNCQPSPYLDPVTSYLKEEGFTVQVEKVPYESQRNADSMLRVC